MLTPAITDPEVNFANLFQQNEVTDDYELKVISQSISDNHMFLELEEIIQSKNHHAYISLELKIEGLFAFFVMVNENPEYYGETSSMVHPYIEELKTFIIEDSKPKNAHILEGYVSFDKDQNNNPSTNQSVTIEVIDDQGQLLETHKAKTDIWGFFYIDYNYPIDEGYKIRLSAPLVYHQFDTNRELFKVVDKSINSEEAIILDLGEFSIQNEEDLFIEADLLDVSVLDRANSRNDARDYVYFYKTLKDGIEFYEDTLFHKFELFLPIRLVLNNDRDDSVAYMDTTDGDIYINRKATDPTIPEMPATIYHELSHYVMADMYYPNYPSPSGDEGYHGGYANSDTSGSFGEGFAYYMQYIMEIIINGQSTDPLGNLELNHKAWENSGFSETYAVASTLFDLMDSSGDLGDDDGVNINIWPQLMDRHENFGQFYDTMISAYPNNINEINQVFIDYGFYVVTDVWEEGRGTYQHGEAFLDTGNARNKVYQAGHRFVDYNSKDTNGNMVQEYRDGYKIGYYSYS